MFIKYIGNALTGNQDIDDQQFSTYDQDHDQDSARNCAEDFQGAWWYRACHDANLNGKYGQSDYGIGINWNPWRGYEFSMKKSEMKLRPINKS